MEESEKELIENLKNFDLKKLFFDQTYVEVVNSDNCFEAFITAQKDTDCFEIIINRKKHDISYNYLSFYGENDNGDIFKKRENLINIDLGYQKISDLIKNIKKYLNKYNISLNSKNNINNSEKENARILSTNSSNNVQNNNKTIFTDRKGKLVDITGYLTYQFLEGFLMDCLYIFNNRLFRDISLVDDSCINLFNLILDIILYLSDVVKSNLNKYKTAYYNRKLLIVSQIHAILICFDSLIWNLTPNYNFVYKSYIEIENRLTEIVNQVYQIILASKNINTIPLKSLIIFIKMISSFNNKERIENCNKKEIYDILNDHMRNLDKNELIFFKKDSSIREICNDLVSSLFNTNMEAYIDETFYSYLLSCLKCNNLEKKMNALNDISEKIDNEFKNEKKISPGFKNFIESNNILDMFFEDSIHDEVIKRSIYLFRYLARCNCLKDNIIEKIIQRHKNNDSMKELLFGIIAELPKQKKDILFKRLSQGLNFDDEKCSNIDYISKLTMACLSSTDRSKYEKERKKEEDNDVDMDGNQEENDYYGLNLFLDYIIKDFNVTKIYSENNADKCITYFLNTVDYVIDNYRTIKVSDIFYFIEKLFENIKSNSLHNSIIQSIKLIDKLINIKQFKKYRSELNENIKILDEKYDIITLLIDDLIRYINKLPNDYTNENIDNIYEGIYPHYINIGQRLNLIFHFFKKNLNNYGLVIQGKKHIEKIYETFKPAKFIEERKKFYQIITKNISRIDNIVLMEFFKDILQNRDEFDLKSINDNETTDLIIQIFKQINFNEDKIFDDGRKIRVGEEASLEGTDMLFDLLTQNPNTMIQEKVSQLLCDVCLSHMNYNSEKISDYWRTYFDKINSYLNNIINSNDKTALNGIIKLINKIYLSSCNCCGIIPSKSSLSHKETFKLYHFLNMNVKKNHKKDYKWRVYYSDKIIDLRWKAASILEIPVNNVTFIDLNGNEYNLNNDFQNFIAAFKDEKYLDDKDFEYIKIKEVPFGLLDMKDNPKFLIETNDKLFNILFNSLKIENDNIEDENKHKIWNFLSNLPKNFFFENKIKKFGNKEKVNDNEISEIFNINEIYLMTYSLECLNYFLFDKNDEKINKEEFLNNFIEVQKGEEIITNKLFDIKVDPNNVQIIEIECLNVIIDVLIGIEIFKGKKEKMELEAEEKNIKNEQSLNLHNNILNKLTEIISNFLEFNYDIYNDMSQESNDLNESDIIERDENININKKISDSISKIFSFIDKINRNKVSYINFLFNDAKLFIKIFVNDYIKLENEDVRKFLEQYLYKNIENNSENIIKYLELILTEEIFKYLIENDKTGICFHFISFAIKKYFDKKENKENKESEIAIQLKHTERAQKMIDLIIDYIQQEFNKNNDNEKENEEKDTKNKEIFKEKLIIFLTNILNINPKDLTNYITTKVDICDFFLKKCNLRKCVSKPLDEKEPFCLNNQSKGAVYKLILFILKNINNEKDSNLYTKIIDILDDYHKLGFWKTYNTRNWDIESRDIQKAKYVGLKNMTSTCYLNSIIQQLFMIQMFRETIMKIENPFKDNVLYELQLVFSALKIYEFPYYSPESFVISNNLNFHEQMDADEFYGNLIDKIENDIKRIYSNKTLNLSEGKNPESIQKGDKNENYKYKDVLNYFFGIKVLDELLFVDCGHKRYNEFCYNNIQLEIKEFSNIYESLKNYFRTEVMDGDNKINCEQCNIKRTCHKHLFLKSLPNNLVISLKRFEFDYDIMSKYKLNKYFEFPHELDMKDYLIEKHTEENTVYELTGITIHFGYSDFGHYYDLIKGPDNKWYKFNDINITEFREEDIPKEAFGEKEENDDDSYREKESGKNNAYILIYTKKGSSTNKCDKSDLAFPPYNKYSNIKPDMIDIINYKLFKNWAKKNIFSASYQNFVLGLMKMDVAKIIDENIEKSYSQLCRIMRIEGYLKDIKENAISSSVNDNNKIFQFGLRYFFNVILRINRKSQDKTIHTNIERFKQIINIYMEKDLNKAIFILEEFSDSKIIDEFIIYCPKENSLKDISEIVNDSFKLVYNDEKDDSNDNAFYYKFINSLFTYITFNIRQINLESITGVLYKIINILSREFINYMKRKNMSRWMMSFCRKIDISEIINETNLPTIHSNHSILKDSSIPPEENNENLRKIQNEEIDIYDHQMYNRLHDFRANQCLLEELRKLLLL